MPTGLEISCVEIMGTRSAVLDNGHEISCVCLLDNGIDGVDVEKVKQTNSFATFHFRF